MATSYLLDTNILIAALNGEMSILNRLAGLVPSRLPLSAIVLSELLAGAEKSRAPAKAHAAITELIRHLPLLAYDTDAAHAYAGIRSSLERKGTPIGPMDMLIAAQAVSRELVLITENEREFQRIASLHCQNWMR